MTGRRWLFGLIGLLMAVHAALAIRYAAHTSPTYDETGHLVAGYVMRHAGDFRVVPDHPPLWVRWVALALPAGSMAPRYSDVHWDLIPYDLQLEWQWASESLYPKPGTAAAGTMDGRDLIFRGRMMMLVFSVFAIPMTALLTWMMGRRLGLGERAAAVAAVMASALFSMDPVVLGNAALVKNDVASALVFLVAQIAMLLLLERVTPARVAFLALWMGFAVTVKTSAVILLPVAAIALFVRAAIPRDWPVGKKWNLRARGPRGLAAGAILLGCVFGIWGMIWAAYDFRYEVSKDGPVARVSLEIETVKRHTRALRLHQSYAAVDDARDEPLPAVAALMVWAHENRLLPSPFCQGFLYVYATTELRQSFLCDEIYDRGWVSYFPLCVAFKEPLGTLGLLLLGSVGAAVWLGRWGLREWRAVKSGGAFQHWERLGLLTVSGSVVVLYGGSAVFGHMDAGIRHLMPLYPVAAVGIALVVARTKWTSVGWGRSVPWVLLLGTVVEMGVNYDRFISFFNLPSRVYGPQHLLADANLDWGQDLPKLVEWQKRNPDLPMMANLSSACPPEMYGLKFTPLAGAVMKSWLEPKPMAASGVLAISATWLQEFYLPDEAKGMNAIWRYQKPREVLGGGTIFIYDLPPTQANLAGFGWRIKHRFPDGKIELLPNRPRGLRALPMKAPTTLPTTAPTMSPAARTEAP